MKLIIDIHERTLAEDDTDPLGEAESLVTRGSPNATYHTTRPRYWGVEDGRTSHLLALLCSTRHLVDTRWRKPAPPANQKGSQQSRGCERLLCGRELRGRQGCTVHILCFGGGYSVIMMFEFLSLTINPSIPPCLVCTTVTPIVTTHNSRGEDGIWW